MRTLSIAILIILAGVSALENRAAAAGDPAAGAKAFQVCAACHSLHPDVNMTGPSLAGVWGRRAGTLASFKRYSAALRVSGFLWNERTLDQWLTDPGAFIPNNRMTMPGIANPATRANIIAFLKASGETGNDGAAPTGMGAAAAQTPDLKALDPAQRVNAIRYCPDTYHVSTADGQTHDFWERNLRFKTDSSIRGPKRGEPALLRAGMMGDRASIIFATPGEISTFVRHEC